MWGVVGFSLSTFIIIIVMIIIIIMIIIMIMIIVITGIANVGGLAGTQMPERVLSDAYEKGGKQMIGLDAMIIILKMISVIIAVIIIMIII